MNGAGNFQEVVEEVELEISTDDQPSAQRELSLLELDGICHEAHMLILEYRNVLRARFPEGGMAPLSREMSEMRQEFYRLSDWLIDVIANVHMLISAHEGEVAYREAVAVLQSDNLAGDMAALARGERFPKLPLDLQDLFKRAAALHQHLRQATQNFR